MDLRMALKTGPHALLVATALATIAGLLRLWPLQALGTSLAWLTFYPAVAVAALYGGLAAGLLATCLSCFLVIVALPIFVRGYFVTTSADLLGLAVFTLTSTLISFSAEARLRANQRAERAKEQAEAASADLEAFSYSVAHDLRSPLRSIDGFSRALLEDYGEKLDAEGQRYLHEVMDSARHMGFLIDDLLTLSRVSRSEVRVENVDLSELAREALERCQKADTERRVATSLQKDLRARGDPRLLSVALDNLFGNAWKFSAKRPDARIEFGALPQGDRPVYFVRDNGAGFDMAYANKLFGVFQRLHSAAEFEGTGIGLATVHRVIRRHRGRVWAEAQVGQGATFYFTLNEGESAK